MRQIYRKIVFCGVKLKKKNRHLTFLICIVLCVAIGTSSCEKCQTCTSADGTIVQDNCSKTGNLDDLTADHFYLEQEYGQEFTCVNNW